MPTGTSPRRTARAGLILLTASMGVLAALGARADDEMTVAVLQLAHARECNSRLHYTAYARRAERDGEPAAACAFRAAALAESVHAAALADQLVTLGAVPAWTIESVTVRSTAENLRQAMENELREARAVYVRLEDLARPECRYDAMAALRYARGAEVTHAALFTQALDDTVLPTGPDRLALAAWGGGPPWSRAVRSLFVCLGDGCVFTTPVTRSCPRCGSGRSAFREVVDMGVAWAAGVPRP